MSGGQRQCVTIARAILRDAPIVLLDEPLTGLDAEAARLVGNALNKLMEGRTVIMISHDVRHLWGMERTVTLEGGQVVNEIPCTTSSEAQVGQLQAPSLAAEGWSQ